MDESKQFEIKLEDGQTVTDEQISWARISKPMDVEYLGQKKTVFVCERGIRNIGIWFKGMNTSMEVSPGQKVYQFFRGRTIFMPSGEKKTECIGKGMGIIENGKVIEERYLDGHLNEITGFKN